MAVFMTSHFLHDLHQVEYRIDHLQNQKSVVSVPDFAQHHLWPHNIQRKLAQLIHKNRVC